MYFVLFLQTLSLYFPFSVVIVDAHSVTASFTRLASPCAKALPVLVPLPIKSLSRPPAFSSHQQRQRWWQQWQQQQQQWQQSFYVFLLVSDQWSCLSMWPTGLSLEAMFRFKKFYFEIQRCKVRKYEILGYEESEDRRSRRWWAVKLMAASLFPLSQTSNRKF